MATECLNQLPFDTKQRQAFRRRLLAWYGKHSRELAWRRTRDPYRVWLSEIMLQQTTVAMATPYFDRFAAAFPTVQDLAAADESLILRMWEGLGYYRRARAMHAAARAIVAEYAGKFPQDVAALMQLPGVGRYTAGAIASFAFDHPAPIVEANTLRVFARLTGYRRDVTKGPGQRHLWAVAEELVPQNGAGRFNHALMELGALVCKPADPHCDRCPVFMHCQAFRLNLQQKIPVLAAKPKITPIRAAAVVVKRNGAFLLRQCPAEERWAGLWDFPRFDLREKASGQELNAQIIGNVRDQTGIVVQPGPIFKTLKHGVTRYRITLDCFTAKRVSGRLRSTADRPVRWTPVSELATLPLSVTGRKIANLVAGG